ncbi:MAG: type II toxin-antitoxin system prevent-host-death family antitoxin [Chloroflexi bacterium]|nr:type II toxin-antitoxin system prevent-host-death family antitoxin [Chloroflexota bacterium]MCI0647549.1 type II toxin-antitoxin system prevent-host-death family antitoxin [Chloroflexota bacterium]MCI0729031.1 type II toxin-antitoxin system prevent-host-death family antitoxin [Chloroflexota bacterium]
MLKTNERIITAEDLADQVHTAITNAQQEPLVVTEDGRPAAYLISVELFDTMLAQLETLEAAELVANLAAGEEQFARGAYKTLAEARTIAEAAWQAYESAE